MVEIFLVEFDGHSSAFLEIKVELAVLVDANVGPRTFTILTRSVNDDSLTVE